MIPEKSFIGYRPFNGTGIKGGGNGGGNDSSGGGGLDLMALPLRK